VLFFSFNVALGTNSSRDQISADSRSAGSGTSLNYSVDADFFWIDQLGDKGSSSSQEFKYASKTLGLTKLDIGLNWTVFESTEFEIGLRPDAALNRNENGSVLFDSRSGTSYRKEAAVSLLDRYQLKVKNNNQFEVAIGVIDSIVLNQDSYPPLLALGLRSRFPRKLFALSFFWLGKNKNEATFRSSNAVFNGGQFSFSLDLFQGREDRSESLGPVGSSDDQSPLSLKPYVGGSFMIRWSKPKNMAAEFNVGLDTDNGQLGVVDERFVRILLRKYLTFFNLSSAIVADVRMSQETWIDSPDKRLVQTSVSLTNSTRIKSGLSILLGYHVGKSERFAKDNISLIDIHDGFQIDLGLKKEVRKNLFASLLFASEKRVVTDEQGAEIGAFDSGHQDSIQRFSLSVNYKIGSNN